MNEKEQGSGEIWARKWEEDKKQKYEPKFMLGFTNLSKMAVSADAKYTLIFNTKALEPGYSVGVAKRNAGIDGIVTVDRLVLVGPATSRYVLPPVPADTIVVHGEADDVVPLQATLDWARPQALPVVVLPGVGHFFHGQLTQLKTQVVQAWHR